MKARFIIEHSVYKIGDVKELDAFTFKNLERRGIVERADAEQQQPKVESKPKTKKK